MTPVWGHGNGWLSLARWVMSTKLMPRFLFYLAGWAGASLGDASFVRVLRQGISCLSEYIITICHVMHKDKILDHNTACMHV